MKTSKDTVELNTRLISETLIPWLTEDLRSRVKSVFEPRYGRALTAFEIEEIADNLTNFMGDLVEKSDLESEEVGSGLQV